MAFIEIDPRHQKNFVNPLNSRRCTCKKTLTQQYYLSTSPRSLTPHTGKMEQILLASGLLIETITAMLMLSKNTKVCSPDEDTDYFDIVAGVLQGHTLTLYLFIISLDYALRTSIDLMKDNGFKLAKERSRRYPAKTITDADYSEDIVLLANTSAQADSLQHSLDREAAGIGLHVNAHKTEYMCFNQRGDISTIKGGTLKLMDRFNNDVLIFLPHTTKTTLRDITYQISGKMAYIN